MFEIGKTYETIDGDAVTIVKECHIGTPYHTVKGDDGLYRYARPSDMGRVTASAFDMSCPKNLTMKEK